MKNYDGEKSDALKSAIVRLIEETDLPRPYAYYIEVHYAAAGEEAQLFRGLCQRIKRCGLRLARQCSLAWRERQEPLRRGLFSRCACGHAVSIRASMSMCSNVFYTASSTKHFMQACSANWEAKMRSPLYLEEAMRRQSLKYYDYLAIKNAYEALEGRSRSKETFPAMKTLKRWQRWRLNGCNI